MTANDPQDFDTPVPSAPADAAIAQAQAEGTEAPTAPSETGNRRHFEDLTLAEVVAQFWHAPQATLRSLREVARTPRSQPTPILDVPVQIDTAPARTTPGRVPVYGADEARQREALQLGIRFAAFLAAWWGSGILANAPVRTESLALDAGAPFLLLAFLLWIAGDIYGEWPALRAWWARRGLSAETEASPEADAAAQSWIVIHPLRILMVVGGLFFSLLALRFNTENQFTFVGFWSWAISIGLWVGALAPSTSGWQAVRDRWSRISRFNWRKSWTFAALIVIMLLAASMRLTHVAEVPPEMTSDHVEKILDSQRVLDGSREIFFPNNGGREAFQMYAMALFSQLPGLSMDFTTLKLLSVIEGMLAVLLMFWLGRSLFEENARLGNLVGLLMAALVAVSYWHTALSRLGLRIVLTTIVTTLLLIYLARAMRHNRRGDYIRAGLVLGFGLYTYQAVRMLPVVIIVGMGLAFLFAARNWRMRGQYAWNFIVLVVIAFVVFVPLFGYWLQYPEDFWRRTSGRLLGDDIIQETQADGTIITRNATIGERLEAFNENLPILTNNLRTALLMFNWKGDVAWINAAPNRPALDSLTGALFVIGLAAWLMRMVRRRDMFDWLVPLIILIMLLPSALSIAYPVENPSHTRTSGALPAAYLIAALPLALMVYSITRLLRDRHGVIISLGLVGVVVLGAQSLNSSIYFNDYRESYLVSALPYSEAGRILRGFAESDGAYGNAFMVAYPYWWDHRAVGIEAGRTDWPNGIVNREDIPVFLAEAYWRTDAYRLNPERDLLFFYSTEDDDTEAYLQQLFPTGYSQYRQSYQADDDYKLFRVPYLDVEGFEAFVGQYAG